MKISKLKFTDIIFKASISDLEKIVFCKRNKIVDSKTDVGILLGGISMIPDRALYAYDLYKNGKISKILLSGGVGTFNLDRKKTEASKLVDYFLDKGVSYDDLIIEDKSKTTIENVDNSFNILRDLYDLDKTTFSVITSDFHLLRSVLLFEKKLGHSVVGYGVKSKYSFLKKRILLIKEVYQLISLSNKNMIDDFDVDELSFVKKKV